MTSSADGAGNVTQGSCSVDIDTQPPITNVKVVHDATTGDLTITFLPTDLSSGMTGGLAGTEYQVDGGAWVSSAQLVLHPLVDHSTDGPHTVLYRSTDAVGETEKARSLTVVLAAPGASGEDTYVPQTTVLGMTGLWRDTAAHLTFQAYEDAAGPGVDHTEYSTDDGATWVTGTKLVVDAPTDHSNDGPHLVCYRSVDKAGTVEPAHIVVVGIDTRKPTCSVSGVSAAWRKTPLTLTFSASDAAPTSGIAHIEWSTTAGNWWTAGDIATVTKPGVNQVLYRAVDDAGNVGASQVTWVRIDSYRPWTKGYYSAGSHRKLVRLRFRVNDRKPSCRRAKVTLIWVTNRHGAVVARFRKVGVVKTNAMVGYEVRLPKGSYRFRVRATDIAGNVQRYTVAGRVVVS